MLRELALTPAEAVEVVVSTTLIYWSFIILVRVVGQRPLARVSSYGLASAVAAGSVVGRAALGYTPDLAGGALALVTLFLMHAIAGRIQRRTRPRRVLDSPPLLLMAGPEVLHGNLKRSHLVEGDLWPRLRLAGIADPADVACVVLEPTGEISVLRRGATLDRRAFEDVRGAEHLDALFGADG
jgi:uncharacterized membrane protein YcaP (DUF421 family)